MTREKISLFDHGQGTNLIVKTAGNACNLDCKYCFEKDKSVSCRPIEPTILEKAIRSAPTPCSLVMHGGEPLIVGLEQFDAYLDIIAKYYPERLCAIRVQTNGTLLNHDWIKLLFQKYQKLNIEIAISLDGTRDMNALRTDYNGNNSFDQILSAFKLLNNYGIKTGMLSVISQEALRHSCVKKYVELLASIPNLKFVKVNALFNIADNALTRDSITPSQYSHFLIELAELYIKQKLYQKFPVEPILSILQRLYKKSSRYCNYSCRKCYHYLSLYPDGSIGPCDCFSINNFSMDNAKNTDMTAVIEKALTSDNAMRLQALIQRCDNCDIYDFCLGGCISHRYYFSGNRQLTEDFCASKHELYQAFQKFVSIKL